MTPKYQPKHGLQEIMVELLNLTERAATFEEAGAGQWAARILRECLAAGFVTPEGEVRKVVGSLAITRDGCIVGDDCRVIYKGHVHAVELFRSPRWGEKGWQPFLARKAWSLDAAGTPEVKHEAAEAARKAGEGPQ